MITATRKYMDALTTALSGDTGITIKAGEHWRADVKNRTLEYDAGEMTLYTPEEAKGLLLHEMAHLMYTEYTGKPSELATAKPVMDMVYNACEDMRIEKKLSSKFGRFAEQPLQQVKELTASMVEPSTNEDAGTVLSQVLSHAIYRAPLHYAEGSNRTRRITDTYYKKMSQPAQKFVNDNQYQLQQITDEVMRCDTMQDVKNICDSKVYPLLKDIIDAIPPEEQKKMSPIAQRDDPEIKNKLTQRPDKPVQFPNIPPDTELEGMLYPYIMTLARRLDQVLKERKAIKIQGLYKTGKLASKNAYRVMTDESRIFSRRNKPNKADYNIVICLDDSGSMEGDRHNNTYIAAYLLKRTFERLNFPVHFIVFRYNAYNIRDLSEYRPHKGGENDDAGALELAFTHLDPKKENIVLTMTDGGLCTDVKPPTKKLEDAGAVVFAVGIGMDNDELSRAYHHWMNVPDVSQLANALISLVARLIHR